MAELCRKKSGLLVAFGACSHMGGIPGLANLYPLRSIFHAAYGDGVFSNVNPDGILPQTHTEREEGILELPTLDEEVKSLDQFVPVDYYLPGCAPPVKLIVDAVMAIVKGELPPPGSVLAPDKALCSDCPRLDSKPDEPFITELKRPHEVLIDEEKCFLAQGLVCMGPATRGGCDHACINGNMPCTGCLGPVSHVRDQGAAALSMLASLVDSNEPGEVSAILDRFPDPAGTLYRYGVPRSLLFKHVKPGGNGGA
jgi:F420-non-reducing hydrogenase small subunit